MCTAEDNFTGDHPGADTPEHCSIMQNMTDIDEQRFEMTSSFLKVNIFYESLNFETIVQSEDYPVNVRARLL